MDTQHVDKSSAFHFVVSFFAALVSTEFSVGLGIGKEVGDYMHYRHFCFWDLFFDVLGAITGTIVRMLILRLVYGYWRYYWL